MSTTNEIRTETIIYRDPAGSHYAHVVTREVLGPGITRWLSATDTPMGPVLPEA